jgi:riboflavin kinase/FMN adenylyltransferase
MRPPWRMAPVPEDLVRLVSGVDALDLADGPLFAVIGVFDGIHLGHRYLLGHLVAEARRRDARPGVITFDSHPDEVIVGAAPPLLLDPDERHRLLEEAGVEVIVVQHFDAALRMTEYDDFVHRITARTPLAGLLMTPDAAFGHDRRGTPETVAALGERDGFDVVVVPPFEIDGRSVRSSDIRAAIASGDLRRAEELLGRPYAIVARSGADGSLDVPLPVALPPAGAYEVNLGPVHQRKGPSQTLVVGSSGQLSLESAGSNAEGECLNLAFVPG